MTRDSGQQIAPPNPDDNGRSPSSGDASDPIRLHDCGRFHRPSEPCRGGDAS